MFYSANGTFKQKRSNKRVIEGMSDVALHTHEIPLHSHNESQDLDEITEKYEQLNTKFTELETRLNNHSRDINSLKEIKPIEKIPLPLADNVANYGNVYQEGIYYKIGNIVYLEGLLQTSGTIGNDTVIATLPENHRPSKRLIFTVMKSADLICRINIDKDGTIKWSTGTATAPWIALNGINFSIA